MVAYSICIFSEERDDILKVVGGTLMPFAIFAFYKYFSMDPVDEGVIINEQEIIIKTLMPEFDSSKDKSLDEAIAYYIKMKKKGGTKLNYSDESAMEGRDTLNSM
jgi:hypothetical protein